MNVRFKLTCSCDLVRDRSVQKKGGRNQTNCGLGHFVTKKLKRGRETEHTTHQKKESSCCVVYFNWCDESARCKGETSGEREKVRESLDATGRRRTVGKWTVLSGFSFTSSFAHRYYDGPIFLVRSTTVSSFHLFWRYFFFLSRCSFRCKKKKKMRFMFVWTR